MDAELKKAIDEFGGEQKFPNIVNAYKFSKKRLDESKAFLLENIPSDDEVQIDIVIFGSLARFEATSESDLDYLVMAYNIPPPEKVSIIRDTIQTVGELIEKFNLKPPGTTGMFGTVLSAPDLTERIGLDQDTNLNHSRRMLILQESFSVYKPELHEKLLRLIIARYLADYRTPKNGVPRFLLNDVIRYWRTIAVDYQAKRWNNLDANWGLRYLKLLISRKIVFAGLMASLLLTKKTDVEYFYKQFSMSSLARIAQLISFVNGKNNGESRRCIESILEISDQFIGKLENPDFRNEAKRVTTTQELMKNSQLKEVRKLGDKLQENLQKLFFEDKKLKDKAIKYMSF